jgi:dTMP kinase
MNSDLGRFITLEGSEGVGKTTNLDSVCRTLDQMSVDYIRTREPGGTPMAEALRENLLARWDESVEGLTELLIVFAARVQHVNCVIRPALASGKWVVCDRFTDASYAYQGYGRGLDLHKMAVLEEWVHGELQPDLTLYLDLDPEIAALRIAGRDQDRMEQEQMHFFHKVRDGYLARAASAPRFYTIDASLPLESVQVVVCQKITEFVSDHYRVSG